MVQVKVDMDPELEDEFRKIVGKEGGSLAGFLLPFFNAIARRELVMAPHFRAPAPPKKEEPTK